MITDGTADAFWDAIADSEPEKYATDQDMMRALTAATRANALAAWAIARELEEG